MQIPGAERSPSTRAKTQFASPPRRRDGHRRETRERSRTRSARERRRRALLDIATYRAVAYQDVVAVHHDGHPYTARRGVNQLMADGLVTEHTITHPGGGSFKVLTATKKGAAEAANLAREYHLAPGQRMWHGLGRTTDLSHDVAVFRAVRAEMNRPGAQLRRVRLDSELRAAVVRRTEKARAARGHAAADAERRRAAADHHLPLKPDGSVAYPDAQAEFTTVDDAGLDTANRVNIEVASDKYSPGAIAAKAAAGFQLHGSNGRALRNIAKVLKRLPSSKSGSRHSRGQEESFGF